MTAPPRPRPAWTAAPRIDTALAWFFVLVWGSGYLASKTGLQYAAPFTFLTLRFCLAALCLLPWLLATRPRWPATRSEWLHIGVAGLLMHAVNLGGSHHAQVLGLSAGITALLLATQPLATALAAYRFLGQRLAPRQWAGVATGLLGVALVVWHKVDVQAVNSAALAAVGISLVAITAGTLYQRRWCPTADLRSAAFIQLLLSALVLAPLAWGMEGLRIAWSWPLAGSLAFLVLLASILATNTLHWLMRRGQATRVTSLLFLTPIVAVVLEWAMYGVVPTALSALGIVVTTAGVALVSAPSAATPRA